MAAPPAPTYASAANVAVPMATPVAMSNVPGQGQVGGQQQLYPQWPQPNTVVHALSLCSKHRREGRTPHVSGKTAGNVEYWLLGLHRRGAQPCRRASRRMLSVL